MISEKDRTDFIDVVKEGFAKKYFCITDNDSYGCIGLHCETPDNGFYCLPVEAESWEGIPKEYVEYEGFDNVCLDVANTILDMYSEELNEEDLGEGYYYIINLSKISNAPVLKRLIKLGEPYA